MRLPPDTILAAIEHPDEFARDAAIEYFSGAFSTDPRVMPAYIRAVEKYPDWRPVSSHPENLVQSDETIRWVLDRLAGHGREPRHDAWYRDLVGTLLAADVPVLRNHEAAIAAHPRIDREDKEAVADRLGLASVPPEELWRRLEVVCRRTLDRLDSYPPRAKQAPADRLALALAAHPDFAGERVLAVLRGETGDRGKWLEAYATRVARHVRFAGAVPTLTGLMLADPDDAMFEEVQAALAAIGSDETVDRLRAGWADAGPQTRFTVIFVFERIHSDRSVTTALRLAEEEHDLGNKGRLYEAALRSFAPGAVEPARQLALRPDGVEPQEIRYSLVATCPVMDIRFPEYGRWREEIVRNRERAARVEAEWEQEELAESRPKFDRPPEALPLTKEGPKVGRNDPCPCGSGKKYKKCCGANKG
jgi:hypothetical protein